MTALDSYIAGNVVILTANFTVAATGVLTDPSTVVLKVGNGEAGSTTYTYGVGSTITRQAAGEYQANIDTTGFAAGTYVYEWISTGTAQAVAAGAFIVTSEPL